MLNICRFPLSPARRVCSPLLTVLVGQPVPEGKGFGGLPFPYRHRSFLSLCQMGSLVGANGNKEWEISQSIFGLNWRQGGHANGNRRAGK